MILAIVLAVVHEAAGSSRISVKRPLSMYLRGQVGLHHAAALDDADGRRARVFEHDRALRPARRSRCRASGPCIGVTNSRPPSRLVAAPMLVT